MDLMVNKNPVPIIDFGKVILDALRYGIVVDGKHIEQVYACYVDDEYFICKLTDDACFAVKDINDTWELFKETK